MYKLIVYSQVVCKTIKSIFLGMRVFSFTRQFEEIGIQEMLVNLVLKHKISIRDIVEQSELANWRLLPLLFYPSPHCYPLHCVVLPTTLKFPRRA